jgi:hypothetical protein
MNAWAKDIVAALLIGAFVCAGFVIASGLAALGIGLAR